MNVELFSLEGSGLKVGAAIGFHPLRETVSHLVANAELPATSLVSLDADLWEVSQHLVNMREVMRISVCWDAASGDYRLAMWNSDKSMIHSLSAGFSLSATPLQFSMGGRVNVAVHSEQSVSGIPVPIVNVLTLTYGSSVFKFDGKDSALADSVVPTWEVVPQIN